MEPASKAVWGDDGSLTVELIAPSGDLADSADAEWSTPIAMPFAMNEPCDALLRTEPESDVRSYRTRRVGGVTIYRATVSVANILRRPREAKGLGLVVALEEHTRDLAEGMRPCRGVVTWDPGSMYRSLTFQSRRGW